jgi:hypothetical protein
MTQMAQYRARAPKGIFASRSAWASLQVGVALGQSVFVRHRTQD